MLTELLLGVGKQFHLQGKLIFRVMKTCCKFISLFLSLDYEYDDQKQQYLSWQFLTICWCQKLCINRIQQNIYPVHPWKLLFFMAVDIGVQKQFTIFVIAIAYCLICWFSSSALFIKLDHVLACRYPSRQNKVQMASAFIKVFLNLLHSGG